MRYAPKPESDSVVFKFSSTNDGGQSWRQVASLPEEPPQAFLGQITITGNNRL
jgi:hypothetical protein